MRIEFKLWVIGLVLMISAVGAQAQQFDPSNKAQMRQLAFDYCSKAGNVTVCNCFADTLAKKFNAKDWALFIADTQKSSVPPAGVGESDIDTYGQKLADVGNVCGLQ